MKYLIIALVIILTGCSSAIPGWDVDKAEKYCSDKGGIYHISTWTDAYGVLCSNGEFKKFLDIK